MPCLRQDAFRLARVSLFSRARAVGKKRCKLGGNCIHFISTVTPLCPAVVVTFTFHAQRCAAQVRSNLSSHHIIHENTVVVIVQEMLCDYVVLVGTAVQNALHDPHSE